MAHLKGFKAFSVDPQWQDLLAFDGDLKLSRHPSSIDQLKGHFFEIISRENDVVLAGENPDPLRCEKQEFLSHAGEELCSLITKGAYHHQPEPVVYVYTIEYRDKTQIGILADLDHRSYANSVIHPHEETLEGRVDIIASITKQSGVFNGFPIIFARFEAKFVQLLREIIAVTIPLVSIERDEIRHSVYKTSLQQTAEILEFAKMIPEAFIADGHHRFKGFSKFIKNLPQDELQYHSSDFESFPVFLVSEESLEIKKFHRVLTNLHGKTEEEVLAKAAESFFVEPIDLSMFDKTAPDYRQNVDARINPRAYGHFSIYLHESRRWFSMVQRTKIVGDPAESLDIQYLADHFLRDVVGIPDLRKCSSIRYFPSVAGLSEFIEGREEGKLSIVCAEISIQEVKDVALADLRMPPKATLFYPKPLLGMLFKMHLRLPCNHH